jgi:exopolysaccharide biosynthesis polyprenyl glycosylphosphotransferase
MLKEGEINLSGVAVRTPHAGQASPTPSPALASSSATRISTRRWRAALMVSDLAVGSAAILLAVLGRFGASEPLGPGAAYLVLLIGGPVVWLTLLLATGVYNPRRLASGAAEFGRIIDAGLWMLAAIVGASYLTRSDLSREVAAVTVTSLTLFTLAVHLVGRLLLQRRLRVGGALHRVLVVGSGPEAERLVDHIARLPHTGLRVVGVCPVKDPELPIGAPPATSPTGTVDEVIGAARRACADTIAVSTSAMMTGSDLRRLSWSLEGTGIRLLVAPGVTELAGPRLLVLPVGGLPLLHVKEAEFGGANWAIKAAIDRVGAALLCIALAPLFAVIAIAVRTTSPGPALFRQRRVGLHGRDFTVLKFRTMYLGSDRLQDNLLDLNEQAGVLFKIRRDPRVTPVGRLLRRYSLDELPQIWNALAGSMSLVGPRPPLRSEVDRYPGDLRRRRLLVKPGITGLWQVSGRSDLSWEETVRLDLQYVENWSVLLDTTVLWKTVRAVASGRGAY